MKKIEVYSKKNKFFIFVDDEDLNTLNQYKWYLLTQGKNIKNRYAFTIKNKKTVYMHRLVLNAPKNSVIDHKDHNGLNNQKDNLRLCSSSNNMHNMRNCRINKTSLYKGVCWHKSKKVWCVQVYINKKRTTVGSSKNEVNAAKLYNYFAKQNYGKFACLNTI